MKKGIDLLEKAQETFISNHRRVWYALSENILGEVNSQIATGPKPSIKKAEEHFNKAIELLQEIGAKGFLGQAYMSLGLLYKASKKTNQARQCILKAINVFQECESEVYIKQANEALDSLAKH